jgi:uncharacterized membrane protein HdeD (DUF308 family)
MLISGEGAMFRTLIHNWWLLVLRGVFALLFATFAFSLHVSVLASLLRAIAFASVVVMFGLFAFSAGIFTLIAGLRGSDRPRERWLLVLDGGSACIAGLIVVLVPSLTLFSLVHIIAWWALFVGACEMAISVKLRRHIVDEWLLAASSVASLAMGAYLLLGWTHDETSILLWIGTYSVFSGVTMLALAFRLRSFLLLAHRTATAGD